MNPINSRASLITHLQTALEIEHATIPPYLCALYSIHDGSNTAATDALRGVVMEEMLHMTLVANLLNAVGGEPMVNHPAFVPKYPTHLPHCRKKFPVQLLPFSHEAIETFLKIERPAKPNAAPEADDFDTIAQFYEAIRDAIELLARRLGERRLFSGNRKKQISGGRYYYGGGGEPIAVTDLASARAAIAEVIEQGEGLHHTIFDGNDQFGEPDELAHYFRFQEIRVGRRYVAGDTPSECPSGPEIPVDWSARYPMRPNPRVSQYRGKADIVRLMTGFNERYGKLLGVLHDAFNGKQERLEAAVPLMYELKYRAQELMAVPSGHEDGTTVGPSFEFRGAPAA